MYIYQTPSPFLYAIGWSDLNAWYLGVKYARDCSPLDLWTTYFTSSDVVAALRELYGEPDCFELLATGSSEEMRTLEVEVLKGLGLLADPRWLNRGCSRGCDPALMRAHWADPEAKANHSAAIRAAMREPARLERVRQNNRKRANDPAHRAKVSAGLKGRPKTEAHRYQNQLIQGARNGITPELVNDVLRSAERPVELRERLGISAGAIRGIRTGTAYWRLADPTLLAYRLANPVVHVGRSDETKKRLSVNAKARNAALSPEVLAERMAKLTEASLSARQVQNWSPRYGRTSP